MALDCKMPYSITIMSKYPHCGVNLSLTLNQRVVGSNPTAPTNLFNELDFCSSAKVRGRADI